MLWCKTQSYLTQELHNIIYNLRFTWRGQLTEYNTVSEIWSCYAEQWCSRRKGCKKRKINYKCMWAGSLCGLSAGLKNQRMKVRHLPGPPIKYASIVQSAETVDLKSIQCEFESHQTHHMPHQPNWQRHLTQNQISAGSNPVWGTIYYDLFYKCNKRCIHREKGRDTEMYPIKLSQTKRLILRCVPYWQILARTLLQE